MTNDRKLMIDQPNSEVLVGGAAAPTDAVVAGGTYNSSPITLTNGQSASFQFTATGSAHMTVDNANNNGFAVATNSSPVVQAFSASTTLQSCLLYTSRCV